MSGSGTPLWLEVLTQNCSVTQYRRKILVDSSAMPRHRLQFTIATAANQKLERLQLSQSVLRFSLFFCLIFTYSRLFLSKARLKISSPAQTKQCEHSCLMHSTIGQNRLISYLLVIYLLLMFSFVDRTQRNTLIVNPGDSSGRVLQTTVQRRF